MVVVDREAGIFGDRGGDRLAHPAIGRDEADADRLFGGAHGIVRLAKPFLQRQRRRGRADFRAVDHEDVSVAAAFCQFARALGEAVERCIVIAGRRPSSLIRCSRA